MVYLSLSLANFKIVSHQALAEAPHGAKIRFDARLCKLETSSLAWNLSTTSFLKGLLQAMGMGMLHLQAFHPCVHRLNSVGIRAMTTPLSGWQQKLFALLSTSGQIVLHIDNYV
jgi:hypothetical protein